MAVRYRYQTSAGTHEMRMWIPESTGEELRGNLYTQEQLDWLHKGQQGNVLGNVDRLRALIPELELVEVWMERADGTRVKPPIFMGP